MRSIDFSTVDVEEEFRGELHTFTRRRCIFRINNHSFYQFIIHLATLNHLLSFLLCRVFYNLEGVNFISVLFVHTFFVIRCLWGVCSHSTHTKLLQDCTRFALIILHSICTDNALELHSNVLDVVLECTRCCTRMYSMLYLPVLTCHHWCPFDSDSERYYKCEYKL